MAPVAAEIIAGRPPRKAIETAIVNDANSPTRGSTPAMIENEIASGMSASATTSPARTSVRSMRGERRAARTDGSGIGGVVAVVVCSDKAGCSSGHQRLPPVRAGGGVPDGSRAEV